MHHSGGANGAGGAQRVAQGNGAAHGVDLGGVQAQGVDHGKRLGGKGFVQLVPADVLALETGVAQRGGNGLDGADTHDFGRHAACGVAHEARQWREAELLDGLLAGQDQRACAVAGLRAVARRHAAARGEHGPELGQAFERGVGAGAFVQVHGAGLGDDFPGGQVGHALQHVDGCDFVGEFARLLRLDGAHVRLQREGVLHLARHLPLLGHLLGRQAHAVGNADVLVLGEHLGIERGLATTHGHHAHGLGTTGDHHVGLAHADAVGGHLDGRDARSTETVDGDAAHRVAEGQAGGDTCHVHALLAFGEGAADDGVFDRLGVQRGDLQHGALDGGDQQLVRTGVAEIAAARTPDGRARGGNDVGVLDLFHDGILTFGVWRQGPPGHWFCSCWRAPRPR